MLKIEASKNPPKGKNINNVPMFVSFGFDDNGMCGSVEEKRYGIDWASEFFSSIINPDGTRGSCSFYFTTSYLDEVGKKLEKAWIRAIEQGNEAGCHTHTHPHGRKLSVDSWLAEINLCKEYLDRIVNNIENKNGYLYGFRTPYLEYNNNTFKAVAKSGFIYDCSIEEGWQQDMDGTNYLWPYTLHKGSPGHNFLLNNSDELEILDNYPGIIEMPIYAFIVPPDEKCEEYDVKEGFRKRMKDKNHYFDIESGKITGLDWNFLVEYQMNKEEFLAILKYNFDLRIKGNRAPFLVGAHSDVYSPDYHYPEHISWKDRQEVIELFIEYALSYDFVKVVSHADIIKWIKSLS